MDTLTQKSLLFIENAKVLGAFEGKGINQLMSGSHVLGLIYLNDAVQSYIGEMKNRIGSFVPSMNLEYRTFIISLLEEVLPEYSELVIKELFTKDYAISIDEVLNATA